MLAPMCMRVHIDTEADAQKFLPSSPSSFLYPTAITNDHLHLLYASIFTATNSGPRVAYLPPATLLPYGACFLSRAFALVHLP